MVSLTLQHRGQWEATLLQGQHLNISHRCQDTIRVAERANVSLGNLSSHFLVGRTEIVSCESSGGDPPPLLTAAVRVEDRRRQLQVRRTSWDSTTSIKLHSSRRTRI